MLRVKSIDAKPGEGTVQLILRMEQRATLAVEMPLQEAIDLLGKVEAVCLGMAKQGEEKPREGASHKVDG